MIIWHQWRRNKRGRMVHTWGYVHTEQWLTSNPAVPSHWRFFYQRAQS